MRASDYYNKDQSDDFTRQIYGFLGIPIDVTSMRSVVHSIETAAARAKPLRISTANVNFLINSRSDCQFRDSLIRSDVCTADGMPIVWLSRLLGIPMRERVAGSDLFDVLNCVRSGEPLKVFLFGGGEGVAAKALAKINAQSGGIVCVGALYPGYDSVDAMSSDQILDTINASNADCLVVALSAQKGHLWLERNHHRLTIPIRATLGATINFQAGTIRRAPERIRDWGLEWLFRIKEEPRLWRRYFNDGRVLARLILTHVFPLLVLKQLHRLRSRKPHDIVIERRDEADRVTLLISGVATVGTIEKAAPYFQQAVGASKDVVINLAGTRQIDARFIGILLVLHKRLKEWGRSLTLTAVPRPVERLFRLNGFTFLL